MTTILNKKLFVEMKVNDFLAKGKRLYGDDKLKWKFKCPICGIVATGEDYKKAGAPDGAIGFSCIGRYLPKCRSAFNDSGPGPCDYTGGGLFKLNPIIVKLDNEQWELMMFDFADKED